MIYLTKEERELRNKIEELNEEINSKKNYIILLQNDCGKFGHKFIYRENVFSKSGQSKYCIICGFEEE